MVKAGGISSFVMVALAILAAVIGGTVGGIFNLIVLALFVFVLISLHVNLRQHNFPEASGFIWGILGLLVAIIVLSIIAVIVAVGSMTTAGSPGGNPMAMFAALGVWGIIIGLMLLGLLVCFLLLGVKLQAYGGVGGGGLWKGTGIVAIIASALMLAGVVFGILTAITKVGGLGVLAAILYIVGALVFLAFWIMLGIGLIQDADRPAAA
jgi:hypothetical protein